MAFGQGAFEQLQREMSIVGSSTTCYYYNMKNLLYGSALLLTALLFSNCKTITTLTVENQKPASKAVSISLKKQIIKEIDAEVKKWDQAAANKDAESLSNLYAENADIIHYDNIQHVGRGSIRQHFEKQLLKDPHLKKTFSDHQRLVLSPEIVIETAKSHITGSKISPPPPTRGRYTATYFKKNEKWLIVYERAWWTWPFKYD